MCCLGRPFSFPTSFPPFSRVFFWGKFPWGSSKPPLPTALLGAGGALQGKPSVVCFWLWQPEHKKPVGGVVFCVLCFLAFLRDPNQQKPKQTPPSCHRIFGWAIWVAGIPRWVFTPRAFFLSFPTFWYLLVKTWLCWVISCGGKTGGPTQNTFSPSSKKRSFPHHTVFFLPAPTTFVFRCYFLAPGGPSCSFPIFFFPPPAPSFFQQTLTGQTPPSPQKLNLFFFFLFFFI